MALYLLSLYISSCYDHYFRLIKMGDYFGSRIQVKEANLKSQLFNVSKIFLKDA